MADFYKYLPLLSNAEGGFQKHPSDTGNYNSLGQLVGTNYGISAKTYEDFIKRPPTENDMRSMPKSVAIEIYKQNYWHKMKGNFMTNQSVANILIDHGVNAGVGRASRLVQNILKYHFNKNISVDGAIGNETLTALNNVNQYSLFQTIKKERENYYKSLGGVFLDGWLSRLKAFFFQENVKETITGGLILILSIASFLIYKGYKTK